MLSGGPNVAGGAFQLPGGSLQGDAPVTLLEALAHSNSVCPCVETSISTTGSTCKCGGMYSTSPNSPDFGYVVPNLGDQLFGQPTLSLNQSYGQSGSLYQPGGPRSLQWMFRVNW